MISIFGIPRNKKKKDELFQINYKKYYPIVYKNIYYLTGNNELAEDILQEVFIKYYDSDMESIEYTGAWLSKVATNTALNFLRGEKRRSQREENLMYICDDIFSIEDDIFRTEDIKKVRKVLKSLSNDQRICLLMKFSGYSYDEIHMATNINRSNISQLIARGKDKFANLYEKED